MATRTQSPSPQPTTRKQEDNLPAIIAAIAGGGALLLILSALVVFLLLRRKRQRSARVLLRGRQSKEDPGTERGVPLRYVITSTGIARPSLSNTNQPNPRPENPPQRVSGEKPPRPVGIHEAYQSPYSSMALEKVYETLERGVSSPVPSFFSTRTDGVGSGVASARASSELNHGRAFRSFDQSPPATAPRRSLSQAIETTRAGPSGSRPVTAGSRPGTAGSRPGTAGSARPRSSSVMDQPMPVVARRPSQVKRDLLAALESNEPVEVVRRSEYSFMPPNEGNAPSAFERYRPP